MYLSKLALAALAKSTDLKDILCCLSEYLGTVYTDLTVRELAEKMKDDSGPLSLLALNDVKIASCPEHFAKITRNYSTVLEDPSALYVLNIPEATARYIQQEYGVLCRSYTNPDMDFLLNGKRNKTTSLGATKSWDQFFGTVRREYIEPCNTIIVSDRYLFTDTTGFYNEGWTFKAGRGVANCIAIINNLLPGKISTPFSILICFDANDFNLGPGAKSYKEKNPSEASKSFFDYLSQTLYSLVSIIAQEKGYPIDIEILGIGQGDKAYGRTHNRRVLTNYAEMYTEQDLAAFKIDKVSKESTPVVSQHLDYKTLFAAGVRDDDDCPVISHIEKINDFIEIFSPNNWNKNRLHSYNGELSMGRPFTKNAILLSEFRRRKTTLR